MNISWLTLRDLEYLVTVARLEHFGKAAEACYVSQPALSAQIRKIEDFLGVRLFERSNRKVAITDVGRPIVAQALVVLEEAGKIIGLAQKSNKPLTGGFGLGAIATLGPYLLPHWLKPLRRSFPELELHLREGLTDDLIGELRAGNLEAVLAAKTFDERGLKVYSLFIEPFYLAVPKEHPLCGLESLRVIDLKSDEMVLLEDGHCLRDQAIEFCPANRRGAIRKFHATSLETIRHLVASGMGYTLMPGLAVSEDDKLKGLVAYRKFEGKPVGRQIALACRERSARMTDIEALVSFLRKHPPKGTTSIIP